MDFLRQLLRRLTPIQVLAGGLILSSLIGALLLSLPIATADGSWQPFLDALFIAVSAVTTTGLVVVDISAYYSLFGQIIILIIIQIYGISYMTFVILIVNILGYRLSFRVGITVQESLAAPSMGELRLFVAKIARFTLAIELVGAVILAIFWSNEYSIPRAIYLGIFHSVSAFCTAGFSLFSDSFVRYQDNNLINLTINALSLAGGIGFLVLADFRGIWYKLVKSIHPRKFLNHSKLALTMTAVLVTLGTIFVFWVEPGALSTSKLYAALFQAVSASTTTGFNSVDIGALSQSSVFALVLLMFIGAPAGGTGGGIKSTTFAVLLLIPWAIIHGQRDVNLFRRRISLVTISKAVGVAIMAAFWTILATQALMLSEGERFLNLLFEVVSALATAGLSTGITADLSQMGKIIVILTMLVGRIGPLTVGFSLIRDAQPQAFRYPQEDVFVG